MSKVKITEKAAVEFATDNCVSVGLTRKDKKTGVKSMKVGKFTVSYDPNDGGCACWKVTDDNGNDFPSPYYPGRAWHGYVGEAVEKAVRLQVEV